MIDIETIVRTQLDTRYPPPDREPDWSDVLERLAGTESSGRFVALAPRLLRHRLGLALAVGLAAAGAALALAAPWSGSPNFTQQALAAIGAGRYVHLVVDFSGPFDQVIDLSSGRSRPSIDRSETVYDSKTGTYESRFDLNGAVFAPKYHSTPAGPLLTRFVSGYRNALKSGVAHIIGETTVDGQIAKILRFPFPIRDPKGRVVKDFLYEDVAVDADSYAPLWVRSVSRVTTRMHLPGRIYAPPCPCTRVVSMRSSDQRPTLPTPRKWPRSFSGYVSDIRQLAPAEATSALEHLALWPGRTTGGTALRRVTLQLVTTVLISGAVQNWPQISSARGLRLDYRGAKGSLEIDQVASPQGGYGFGDRFRPLPSPGQALLVCDLCQVPRNAPGQIGHPPHMWVARFRKSGLFIAIRSTSRSLVVQAARALLPMP